MRVWPTQTRRLRLTAGGVGARRSPACVMWCAGADWSIFRPCHIECSSSSVPHIRMCATLKCRPHSRITFLMSGTVRAVDAHVHDWHWHRCSSIVACCVRCVAWHPNSVQPYFIFNSSNACLLAFVRLFVCWSRDGCTVRIHAFLRHQKFEHAVVLLRAAR